MESPEDIYIREHSTAPGEALEWIERQTHIRTHYPQMLSGPVKGRFLSLIVGITGARRVLEIGTFTGYSAVCMASALPADGHLDTLEKNDELEDIIRGGFARAGVESKVTLHTGDALTTLSSLRGSLVQPYDLVFIDADKREYSQYYDLSFDMLREGGLIVVDDVLWGGKVYQEPLPVDIQTRSVAAFNEKVRADRRVESVIAPFAGGLFLIRKICRL